MLRIAVCVKQVPEVAELTLDPTTRRLRREGVAALINPFDRRAVLEALRLREEHGGEVVVLSMGPPQAEAALRECLGLGVDRAVHLCDRRLGGADTLATARALARAIERLGANLVLAGRYSIDAETGQVGPEVAELLGVPFLGGVRRLALAPTSGDAGVGASGDVVLEARFECEDDDGAREGACVLPALATCTDRWKTRVPVVLPDDERAAAAPVERWSADDLGGDPGDYGEAGSPTWVAEVQTIDLGRARRVIDARASLDAALDATVAAIERAATAAHERDAAARPRHARRPDPSGAVWVLAERTAAGALRPVALELLAAADALAARLEVGVVAALADPLGAALLAAERDGAPASIAAPTEELARALGAAGADALLVGPDGRPFASDHLAAALAEAIARWSPRMLLAPATALGRDRVPALAARLGLGLTGDAIGLELDADGALRQMKPAFGGLVVAPVLSRTRPEMVTVRPGTFAAAAADPVRPAADVIRAAAAAPPARGARWLRYVAEVEEADVGLESARAVVCVGFGLGSRDRIPAAERLAHRLGGALGATRRVCDSGWVPRQLQIGLSGRSVSPALYLALGVRGSFNHVVGIRRAGAVIAVNRDPEAEIFAAADLGIVADAPGFLEALGARLDTGA